MGKFKPEKCEVCKSLGDHADYDFPTRLVFSCPNHHTLEVDIPPLYEAAPLMFAALLECEVLLEEYPWVKQVVKRAIAKAEEEISC